MRVNPAEQNDIEALYRRYGPMVHRRCQQLLRDPAAAEEAAHDVFVQLLRRRGEMQVQAPSSLLYRIATNTCLNHLRSARRRPADPEGDLLERIAAAPDGEGLAAARSALAWLFAREPDSTRAMAVMHLLDGMTLEEVAGEVGLSVSGVRKRLRALKGHVAELEAV